jgi:hypothetical protein
MGRRGRNPKPARSQLVSAENSPEATGRKMTGTPSQIEWAEQIKPRDRARTGERLALPRRRPVPLCLRGRAGALLLATAWPARHSARYVHSERDPARSGASQGLRAILHDRVRSSDRYARRISEAAAGNAEWNSRPAPRARSSFSPPAAVGVLSWLFLDPRRRGFFGKLIVRALRLKWS